LSIIAGCSPRKDFAPVLDLANKEPVAEEVGEGASAERDASADLPRAERSRLGDVLGSKIAREFVQATIVREGPL
jgi:hypothetical protein